jgi:gamma-glutamylcyclotransferase (GGCT)/AIG2-like uncharacterized protein YtfP
MKLEAIRAVFFLRGHFFSHHFSHSFNPLMPHLFAYGSLMYAQVIAQVLGHRPQRSLPAHLSGWQRRALKNRTYPAAISDAAGAAAPITGTLPQGIDGVVWMDLTDQDFIRLDQFESDEYQRVTVMVRTADSQMIAAEIYEWQDPQQLLDHDWSPAKFEQAHLSDFYHQHRID